jgi:TDG/mug DNA glycosylase family protein
MGENLAVVFCGTTIPEKSTKDDVYYAARGNKFWSVLYRTGLTPRQFRPEEYGLLLAHDIGLSDLMKERAGTDSSPSGEDHDVARFRKSIATHRPGIVAFNGKEAAKRCLGRETVAYGRHQAKFEDAIVYVLPSTADQAKDYWDDKHWKELAAEVRKLRSRR